MEMTFDAWWNENKNSETLYDTYLDCYNDLQSVGEKVPSYEQWAREYYEKEIAHE